MESPSAVPLVLPSCQSVPQTSSGRTSDPVDRIPVGLYFFEGLSVFQGVVEGVHWEGGE